MGGGATDMFESLIFGTDAQMSIPVIGSSPSHSAKSTSSAPVPPQTRGASPPITSGPASSSGYTFVSLPPTALAKKLGSCCFLFFFFFYS